MLSNNQQLPAAPNYQNLTTQQAGLANQLNRPNQITPYGTQSWSTLPSGQSQVTNTLSPNEQTLLNQKEQTGISLGNTGQGLAGQMAKNYSAPLNYNSAPSFQTNVGLGDVNSQLQNASDAVYKLAKMNLDPQWAQADANIRTQLINAGIPQNSDAWDKAMAAHELNKTQAYSNAQYQATQQGMQLQNQLFGQANVNANLNNAGRQQSISEANYLRGLPASELTVLNAATPVTGAPTSMSANGGFGQFTPAAVPNLTGAASQSYQDALNTFGSQNATANNNANMLGNIIKTGISAYPALKTIGTDAYNAYQNYSGASPSGSSGGYSLDTTQNLGGGGDTGNWGTDYSTAMPESSGRVLASDGTTSSLPANYWSQDASGAGTMGTATDAAPAGAGSFGGYDGSGAMDASGTLGSTAAQSAAADPGYMDYLSSGAGYLGGLNSAANIAQGKGGIGDYISAGRTASNAYDAYNAYQAANVAADTGAVVGGQAAVAGTEGAAAGSGAGAGAGAGAGMAAGGAMLGGLMLIAGLSDANSEREKQAQIQGGYRTLQRLKDSGDDLSGLSLDKFYKPDTSYMDHSFDDVSAAYDNAYDNNGDKPGLDQWLQANYAPKLTPDRNYLQNWLNAHPRAAATTDLHDLIGNFQKNVSSVAGGTLPGLENQTAQFNVWAGQMRDKLAAIQSYRNRDAGGA